MQLEPFYRVTFTTPESWNVTREGMFGTDFPRRRVDGALEPEFRGVLETDDGATILFQWEGLATLTDSGMRRLLGMAQHTTDDERYRWLNDRVCAVEGEVRPRPGDTGFDVGLEVSEMVWEAASA